jgi:predicted unusual protein kinase regulating ubiquinone biosynthesis (AarF/ABC1/UbiB family)
MLRKRYRRIVAFFARVTLRLAICDLILPYLGFRGWAQRTRPDRLRRIAVAFRAHALNMGGVWIKVGQFLSSRLDVLPLEITTELAQLQDEVPPEDPRAIRRVAEADLGASLDDVFIAFDPVPLAAASLGQVHRARLRHTVQEGQNTGAADGQHLPTDLVDVVVKVQRPNIDAIIATDLAALRTVGGWLRRYGPIRRRADVPALLDEFTRILYEEIDYLAEGRNAEAFTAHFADRPGVRIPRVFWTHTTKRVLTLEDVYAIRIGDHSAIDAAGIDRGEVSRRLVNTYLQQIFEDGFFHADPHPGNLFVHPLGVKAVGERPWELVFVDFGMVGRVPPNLRAGLREAIIAAVTQDAARMVGSFQMLDLLLPHADLALLERAEAKAFEQFWGKSLGELRQIGHREMHEFAAEFRELVYTMPFQIPQDLILLGRTMAILSGICTGIDREFNIWHSAAPYAEKLIAEEAVSGRAFWTGELSEMARALLVLPRRAASVLAHVERGNLIVRNPRLSEQVAALERAMRRLAGCVVFAALLTSGIQLILSGHIGLGVALLAGAAVALLWVTMAR